MQKTVTYPVRLSPALYSRIKRAAKADGRTAAGYMRRVLDLATTGRLTTAKAEQGAEQERKQ